MSCDAQLSIDGASQKVLLPILQRLERGKRHTSIGFASIPKKFHFHLFPKSLLIIIVNRGLVDGWRS